MQFSNFITLVAFLSYSVYSVFATEIDTNCAKKSSVKAAVFSEVQPDFERWSSDPIILQLFISNVEPLTYWMQHSYDRFCMLIPSVLDHFSSACREIGNEEVIMDFGMVDLWLPIQKAILQYAKIEDLEYMFGSSIWKLLSRFNKSTDLAERILACSKRSCFSSGPPDEQKREADILASLGILLAECPGSALSLLVDKLSLHSVIPECLLKALIKSNNINLRTSMDTQLLAQLFANDLLDGVIQKIKPKKIPRNFWLSILIAGAHDSWNKFGKRYALVNDVYGPFPKWPIFCKSLSYPSLAEFSDRLWGEDLDIERTIETTEGYKDVLSNSSGNDKYLRCLLEDARFLNFLRDNMDLVLNGKLPEKAVNALLESEHFKSLVKEKIPVDEAWTMFSMSLDSDIQKAKIIQVCFSFKPDPSILPRIIGALNKNLESLSYVSEALWDYFNDETKLVVLKTFISNDSEKPLLTLLGSEKKSQFRLSQLVSNCSNNSERTVELVSFFDCIEVDSSSRLRVNNDLIRILKESRKNILKARDLMQHRAFDIISYNWAERYCVFHNASDLMNEIKSHILEYIDYEF